MTDLLSVRGTLWAAGHIDRQRSLLTMCESCRKSGMILARHDLGDETFYVCNDCKEATSCP
jgi:hypothetical protein